MFKKEKNGKTNGKLQKGGEFIGFSFDIASNYDSSYDSIFFKDKHRNK